MTTALQVITRALRRQGVIDAMHSPSAEDAALGLDVLNEMLAVWPANGANVMAPTLALGDAVTFFVPPQNLSSATLDVLSYAGTWNASTNSPSLADGSGDEGTVYRVSVAGTTDLDDVASWAVDDWLVLGRVASTTNSTTLTWQKGLTPARHISGLISMLAETLCNEFGMQVPPLLAQQAADGWATLLSDFIKTPNAEFDPALTRLPSRRWPYTYPSDLL